MSWINENGPERDTVVSSRIRLARNISSIPFPPAMHTDQAAAAADCVRSSIAHGHAMLGRDFHYLPMKQVPAVDRHILMEKHLISQDLVKNSEISALLLDVREQVSIMINEEDHIRMQCILPGLQLEKAWQILDRVDDVIEEEVDYSFDERLGYLTCCPTNVGTGMRASVMMHLPALTMNKQMNMILQTISKIGMTARGLYGEGTEALGSMYQLSNQITLGPTENEIISNLTIVCQQIMEKERLARMALLKINGIQLEDALWRAYGILMNARVLELKEFMALMSQVRLGVSMGIITGIRTEKVDELIILGQPGGIMKETGKTDDEAEINEARAALIRSRLNQTIRNDESR